MTKETSIRIRIGREEKAKIQSAAKLLDVDVSEWIRQTMLARADALLNGHDWYKPKMNGEDDSNQGESDI